MTADEFWKQVGEALMLTRTRKGLNVSDLADHGGPNYKTVQANEDGDIGTVAKLNEHAHSLGVNVVDVFRSVLERQPLSPEALSVLRAFETTTLAGRQALVSTARALLDHAVGKPPTQGE